MSKHAVTVRRRLGEAARGFWTRTPRDDAHGAARLAPDRWSRLHDQRETSPPPHNDNRAAALPPDGMPECRCLEAVLAPEVLRAARMRAAALNVGADQVLIAQGAIGETAYLHHLSRATGLARETFAEISRDDVPLRDDQLGDAAQAGIVPMRRDGMLMFAIAPRGLAARALPQLAEDHPDAAAHVRLSTAAEMRQFLKLRTSSAMARTAADGLHERWPMLSAASVPRWPARFALKTFVAALLAMLPVTVPLGMTGDMLALWFLAAMGLRTTAALMPRRLLALPARTPDRALPRYTVIAALYRETSSVDPLLDALLALDYPPEKLQIILAVESDDLQTRAAIARYRPPANVDVIVAPAYGPRTKPKALNVALPFARGSFIAVFDAEDRPEAGQLRAALAAFAAAPDNVACVQASLVINNAHTSLFTRGIMAQTPQITKGGAVNSGIDCFIC